MRRLARMLHTCCSVSGAATFPHGCCTKVSKSYVYRQRVAVNRKYLTHALRSAAERVLHVCRLEIVWAKKAGILGR